MVRDQWQPSARTDLNGFKAIEAGICYDCGGDLRDNSGIFYERLEDTGRHAFAVAICVSCKQSSGEIEQPAPKKRGKRVSK